MEDDWFYIGAMVEVDGRPDTLWEVVDFIYDQERKTLAELKPFGTTDYTEHDLFVVFEHRLRKPENPLRIIAMAAQSEDD